MKSAAQKLLVLRAQPAKPAAAKPSAAGAARQSRGINHGSGAGSAARAVPYAAGASATRSSPSMAEKRRFLDVWIVESNTVYRRCRSTVVTDWVQQGRLLEPTTSSGRRAPPSGSRLGDSPSFAAYLPRPSRYAADDQAEALEPVQPRRSPGSAGPRTKTTTWT